MAIRNLFSKRQRVARGEVPDVYDYESLSLTFRNQALHIVDDAFGENIYGNNNIDDIYRYVVRTLLKEYGLQSLSNHHRNPREELHHFFRTTSDYERALDVIELCFAIINNYVRTSDFRNSTCNHALEPDEAISELNVRFRENGIGYQFESNQIMRLDSDFIHSEAVRPVLRVLSDYRYKGANEEFLTAHEHYREGNHEECLVECCKAFESTMKTICELRGWAYNRTDTAKGLIATCLSNGLIPSYLDNQLTSLRTLFESGIPTVRNKTGGHGQGAELRVVPEYFARYVLNLAATTILFLVEANSAAEQGRN